MRFGPLQQAVFGTSEGSYSEVTGRENFDSQITLTDFEAALAVSHFGEDSIHRGNVNSARAAAAKTFRLFEEDREIALNLVYPKPDSSELRLYLSARAGFKPDGGDIWFMFKREGELWIGSMSASDWRQALLAGSWDENDSVYQETIQAPRLARLTARDAYARSPRVGLTALQSAGYSCEVDASHELFIGRSSAMPYLEAHHLIPMGVQSRFDLSLDVAVNVFALCPRCHSAVHHASPDEVRAILLALTSRRAVLDRFDLTEQQLLSLYSVETID